MDTLSSAAGPINIETSEYSITVAGDWWQEIVSNPNVTLFNSADMKNKLSIDEGMINPIHMEKFGGLESYLKYSITDRIEHTNEYYGYTLQLDQVKVDVIDTGKIAIAYCSNYTKEKAVAYIVFFSETVDLSLLLNMDSVDENEFEKMVFDITRAITIINN